MTRDDERKACYTTLLPVLALTLVGCGGTPVKPPNNNDIDILADNALNIDTLQAKNIKVAADKSWQSSGILLDNGEHIKVKATGTATAKSPVKAASPQRSLRTTS